MNIRKTITAIAAAGLMIGIAGAAFAQGGITPLPAGTSNPGITPGLTTLTGLTQVGTTGALAFDNESVPNDDGWAGTVTENVYSGVGGHLTFTYQVTVNSSIGGDSVERLSAGNFGGFTTLVGQSASGGTILASGATRSGSGGTVGFNFFGDGVGAGDTSYLLYVTTNASYYHAGTIGLLDSANAGLTGFAPAVPEPGTVAAFAMTGIGILALMLAARRKQAFGPVA